MKEKTFKDLGLDEGDDYIRKVASEYDLGELEKIIDDKDNDNKETEKKIKEIKDKV